MQLVTVPLELVKDAAVEVTKEAVKTAETTAEFGKVLDFHCAAALQQLPKAGFFVDIPVSLLVENDAFTD